MSWDWWEYVVAAILAVCSLTMIWIAVGVSRWGR
ncbi:MAG: hypothetical protein K0R99_5027 [Microbacterium sp.]|jgi:hypothetical protein|nr:hypothetical protein [Microbacterium sp.]